MKCSIIALSVQTERLVLGFQVALLALGASNAPNGLLIIIESSCLISRIGRDVR
jgi:hypothetical protein